MDAVLNRRSIRKYQDREVAEEDIDDLLKAGMSAPSAGNEQPWHFIVIKDKEILAKIPEIHEYADMAEEAPVAILVCGDLNEQKHGGFWDQDCAAATQNILLTIQDKGLGGVWCGIHPNKKRINEFKELFELPEDVIPFSLIPLGYPAERKPPAERFDESKIHINKW
ncbi:MAG: nitroreductase family protein [bacterium]